MNKELLKENRTHGDASFPLNAYHMDIPGGGMVLDCHWHEELEFLMVTSGKATFQIDTDYYNVSAGEAIFINSGELHAGYPLEASPCRYRALVFGVPLLLGGSFDLIQSKYIDPLLGNRFLFNRHITGRTEWERELLHRLSRATDGVLAGTPAYELVAKSELYAIVALIAANSTAAMPSGRASPESCRTEKLKHALKYMQDNYSQKLSIMDISSRLNMSESHFCRLFKQYFKRTPVEYLNYYRIGRASRLLEETDLKILDISMEAGFDNLSYFIGTFKRHMGVTPSRYRNQQRRNP